MLEKVCTAENMAAGLAGAYNALILSYDRLKDLFSELLRSPRVADHEVEVRHSTARACISY